MDKEVFALLEKGGICKVPDPTTPGFYSPVFVVKKKTGDFRLIFNLRILNGFIHMKRFKMDTIRHVREALRQGEWTTSLDLKDAYLHVPVHPAFRKYLRFMHRGVAYHFVALPFGLSTAPGVFTAIATGFTSMPTSTIGFSATVYVREWSTTLLPS